MSGGLGSVFLGDRAHHISILHPGLHPSHSSMSPPTSPPSRPAVIDPILSLQLRIRWLEALVAGMKNPDQKRHDALEKDTLIQRAEGIRESLNEAFEGNEACKKFIKNYDQYAQLLATAAGSTSSGSEIPPTYDTLPQEEFETLLGEQDPDIRAADRDLREIDELDSRGITAAGKLAEHEGLKSRLLALVDAQKEDLATYDALEARIANILQGYAGHVTTLSELFVSWNDLLTEAEDQVTQLARRKNEGSLVDFSK